MPQRKLPDWLAGYLRYTEHTEPPLAFHTWTAVSVLAAALERKVFLEWDTRIYPNEFIILVGPSGQTRKGVAVNIGREFMEKIPINLASDTATKEKLVQDLAEVLSNFSDPKGKIKMHCSLTQVCEELHIFLGERNTDLLAYLTALYDSRATFAKGTKGSGSDLVQGVYYNLLGATAPDWMSSMFPQAAIGGGFWSRTLFVVEEHKDKIIADPRRSGKELALKADLVHDLELIHTITGEMEFDEAGYKAYTSWYDRDEQKIQKGKHPIDDPRFAGYRSRRATHVKKIAMIMSASRGQDLVVTERDFKRALILLEALEKKMTQAASGLGSQPFAEVTEMILQYIMVAGEVRRSEILNQFRRDVNTWILEQVERMLLQMKVITAERVQGDEVIYRYAGGPKPEPVKEAKDENGSRVHVDLRGTKEA